MVAAITWIPDVSSCNLSMHRFGFDHCRVRWLDGLMSVGCVLRVACCVLRVGCRQHPVITQEPVPRATGPRAASCNGRVCQGMRAGKYENAIPFAASAEQAKVPNPHLRFQVTARGSQLASQSTPPPSNGLHLSLPRPGSFPKATFNCRFLSSLPLPSFSHSQHLHASQARAQPSNCIICTLVT